MFLLFAEAANQPVTWPEAVMFLGMFAFFGFMMWVMFR